MTHRFALFTAPLLLAVALSSSLTLAAEKGKEVDRPNCPKGQVWDSKEQRCVLQNSFLESTRTTTRV